MSIRLYFVLEGATAHRAPFEGMSCSRLLAANSRRLYNCPVATPRTCKLGGPRTEKRAPDPLVTLYSRPVGPAKVGFFADVNAAIGVFSTPATLRQALLKNVDVVAQIKDAIELPQGAKFLLLRWGYDLSATASGSVALGPTTSVNFSASGETKGYF